MFRWGVLSTANIARTQLLPAMQDARNGVVTAIASRDLARAREVADRFGAPHAYGSYEELLASPEVDGVYIPLPTSQHIEWSLKAAKAGKHVLCEKPIALNAGEIDGLIVERDRSGLLISEAFMVYYHPQWAKVRELVAEGAIGTLRHVSGVFTYFNRDPGNMRNILELGGGALPDIGVYPTVATRMVTGAEPSRVRAVVERDPAFGTDIYAHVTADFGAFTLNFYCATQMALRQEMVFHGDEGAIVVSAPFNAGDYGHPVVTLHDQSHAVSGTFRFGGERQYRTMLEAFGDVAQGAGGELFSLESSKANQEMIDAVYRAAEHDGWEPVQGG
ncbi:Gfo/Idh/MocA family protein [Hoeflea prorocentri]|uniref:Gfo/Idh/MocA family oxidoreductase n=1 Tax=Hoeflea prorocentri TaxID=1922333 RepID=A0A9X3ZJ39_9HYPH|nr:Gfo/Idh/MocA family oxidoreductase [Hoeflea prorocentri]MCY6383069.1 Gfo/Idh/MocA family oxidoreductase [Hoeflea prorocentri]MDA5400869.1 Gfo/Idh/MocA family oxidoreductase [Hoeflea prorocentri]